MKNDSETIPPWDPELVNLLWRWTVPPMLHSRPESEANSSREETLPDEQVPQHTEDTRRNGKSTIEVRPFGNKNPYKRKDPVIFIIEPDRPVAQVTKWSFHKISEFSLQLFLYLLLILHLGKIAMPEITALIAELKKPMQGPHMSQPSSIGKVAQHRSVPPEPNSQTDQTVEGLSGDQATVEGSTTNQRNAVHKPQRSKKRLNAAPQQRVKRLSAEFFQESLLSCSLPLSVAPLK